MQLVNALVSITRLNDFMNAQELDSKAIGKTMLDRENALEAVNASFTWDTLPILSNLTMEVKKSSCVAIVGTVGSGKSSLMSALIGDMIKLGGHLNVNGSIAYVPQQAWIQNATLKYNVVFGQNFNQQVRIQTRVYVLFFALTQHID